MTKEQEQELENRIENLETLVSQLMEDITWLTVTLSDSLASEI